MGKLIPIIGAAIAALVIGSGAGWFYGQSSAPKTVVLAEEKPHYVECEIKDRIVNLADSGGRRYLKVSMVLQVAEAKSKGAQATGPGVVFTAWEQPEAAVAEAAAGGGATPGMVPNAPQVHDAITTVLSSKRSDELMTTEGRERLREELRISINKVMPKEKQVAKIFFTEFIIQ
jgi:flagellar protein FliL